MSDYCTYYSVKIVVKVSYETDCIYTIEIESLSTQLGHKSGNFSFIFA